MPLTPPNYGPRPKQSTALDNSGNVVEDGVPIVVEGGKVNFSTANIISPHIMGGRLTLSSTDPAPEATIGSTGTIYYLPFSGNLVTLWDGLSWRHHTIPDAGITKALSNFNVAISNSTNYDVFLFDDGGVLNLYAVAWTNSTTRASNISRADGVYSLDSDRTKRFVGTFRANGSNSAIFSVPQGDSSTSPKLFVWNMDNRLPYTSAHLSGGWFVTGSPLGTVATQGFGSQGSPDANATFECVVGLLDSPFDAKCFANARVTQHTVNQLTAAIVITSTTSTLTHKSADNLFLNSAPAEVKSLGLVGHCNQRFTVVGLNALTASYSVVAPGSTATVFFDQLLLSGYPSTGMIVTVWA